VARFSPRSKADLAKSFILSATFDVGDTTIGRTRADLSRIAGSIAQGTPYQFSPSEVAAVEAQVRAFLKITPKRLVIDLLKWVGPPFLILALAYVLLRST
jgi:hypothetical protein